MASRSRSWVSAFLEDYVPPKLIVRDRQVRQIKDAIDNFVDTGMSSNLLLQGYTGSGKTSTLQYVLKDYDPRLFIFVKCKQHRGIADVLAQVGGLKPKSRQRAPEILSQVIEHLRKGSKIIILDDVTAVPSWPELLDYMDGIYREIQSPIFVTTNMFHFLNELRDDVKHTLLFLRVDFPAYDASELYLIVKQRVDLSHTRFPSSALRLIAALSAESGSARDALAMTRTALQHGKTSEKDIHELRRMLDGQTYLDYLNKLAPKERQVLNLIVAEFTKRKVPIPVRDITNMLGLSPSRTSQLVTGLEQYDVVSVRFIHKGSMGNYRVVEPEKGLVDRVEKGELVLPN